MATAVIREEVGTLYTLDVGFDSSVKQPESAECTVMAFAFAEKTDGIWTRLGSRTLKVKQECQVQLRVFDTSEAGAINPATLDKIELHFCRESPILPPEPPSPFGDEATVIILPGDPLLHTIFNLSSEALDVKAPVAWRVDSFPAINKGIFEGTIEVHITPFGESQKKFCIDPRMIVGDP